MAKQRFCTKYTYAINVSKAEELSLLRQIKSDSPAYIVFDIAGPSMMVVNNNSMATRLPNTYKFIQDNYPNKQQVGRYLVVSK